MRQFLEKINVIESLVKLNLSAIATSNSEQTRKISVNPYFTSGVLGDSSNDKEQNVC